MRNAERSPRRSVSPARAVAEARKTDSPQMQADALADLAEVLRRADRSDEAAAALREALHLYEQKGIIPLARRTRKRLAELENTGMSTASGVSPPPISYPHRPFTAP